MQPLLVEATCVAQATIRLVQSSNLTLQFKDFESNPFC